MCFYTQRLGSTIPNCWVASYPFAGSPPTHSLGTIVLLRWVQLYPFVGYKTDHEQARGLLKCLRPVPVAAEVVVHDDVTTEEVQEVRVVAVPWVST